MEILPSFVMYTENSFVRRSTWKGGGGPAASCSLILMIRLAMPWTSSSLATQEQFDTVTTGGASVRVERSANQPISAPRKRRRMLWHGILIIGIRATLL
ncbi:hypothetical protein CRUP_010390 [Coryphaenoides rupestris]|nr:hypothetical protein CRUP_010390 [Coryphaenoides rupestris]